MEYDFFLEDGDLLEQVELIEAIEESSFISKLMLPIKIRRGSKKEEGIVIRNITDYLRHHYNPGLRKVIRDSKDIDELQYIRADTNTMIPTLNKIKDRIKLCKELGETKQTAPYYKYIKKNYIDKGITEKDCEICIDEIHKQNKMISDKIKELKKK